MSEWFYLHGEEQIGPYAGEQLFELVAGGHIQRETLVWTEGMPEWLPAEQIENLFPAAEPAPQPASPVLQTGATMLQTGAAPAQNPYAAQVPSTQPVISSQDYPKVFVKKANFTLILVFMLIIPLVGFGILFLMGLVVGATEAEATSTGDEGDLLFGSTLFLILLAISIFPFIGIILGYINLHRAWTILQPGGARTTPGKSVGFLFIPFFNLYWLFVTFKGLPEDWNRIMGSYNNTKNVARMGEGIFLAYCIIVIVAGFVAPIFFLIMMAQICKGINSYRANTSGLGAPGASPGGLQLY